MAEASLDWQAQAFAPRKATVIGVDIAAPEVSAALARFRLQRRIKDLRPGGR